MRILALGIVLVMFYISMCFTGIIIQREQTDYKVNHLSSIINAECGTCTDEEMAKVGSVVLNRSDRKNLPIIKILEEPKAFKGYGSNNYYPTEKTKRIATNLLLGIMRDYDVMFFFTGE